GRFARGIFEIPPSRSETTRYFGKDTTGRVAIRLETQHDAVLPKRLTRRRVAPERPEPGQKSADDGKSGRFHAARPCVRRCRIRRFAPSRSRGAPAPAGP